MVRFSKTDRAALHKLHLITGKSLDECREMFEGILTYVVLSYMDGKPSHIPLIGDLHIEYNGIDAATKGKEANVIASVDPDSLIKRIVAQFVNEEPTDVEEMFLRKIKNVLEVYAE